MHGDAWVRDGYQGMHAQNGVFHDEFNEFTLIRIEKHVLAFG